GLWPRRSNPPTRRTSRTGPEERDERHPLHPRPDREGAPRAGTSPAERHQDRFVLFVSSRAPHGLGPVGRPRPRLFAILIASPVPAPSFSRLRTFLDRFERL